MFRSILSECRKTFVLANSISNYCSKPRTQPEINQVILVGTLINDAFTFQSGIQNLSIKTYDASREKYQIHNVHTNGFEGMKAGQRVHVSGKLRSVPIELENEKRRTQTSVVANRIFVLENPNESENSSTEDTNQIDIVANVATNVIKNNDGPHIFKLATHFQRSTDDGVVSGTHFHTVYIFDEHLKKGSENLKASDRVAIHGEIRTTTNTLSDGKKKYSGFIVAKSIEKVQRRAQQENHDDVEHEAHN